MVNQTDHYISYIAACSPFSYEACKFFYDRHQSYDLLIESVDFSAQMGYGYLVDVPGLIKQIQPVINSPKLIQLKENKKIMKPSQLLAGLAWLSTFALLFLIVLRIVPSDKISWIPFCILFFVAVWASAIAAHRSPRKETSQYIPNYVPIHDIEVNMGGTIYRGDELIVNSNSSGKTFIIVRPAMPANKKEENKSEENSESEVYITKAGVKIESSR